MFKSLVKLAFRNLFKKRWSTAINIFSLAIGLTCCTLICLFIQHELRFDQDFDRHEDIYRITSDFGGNSSAPTTTMGYTRYLKGEVPGIEEVARLDATFGTVIIQEKSRKNTTPYQQDNGYWVDPTFFNIFSFNFQYGNRESVLNEPNTIVLSQSLAAKMFGNINPTGRTVGINGNTYTVSGVFKEDILNHFNADFFASNNSTAIRDAVNANTSWVMNPNYYAYVRLKPRIDIHQFTRDLIAYLKRHGGAEMKAANSYLTSGVQALDKIHLYSTGYQSYMEVKQGNINYLYLLGTVALAILILGCINYINLTTAQALGRAREVGVRRTMGATQGSIRMQFFIETILISIMAMIVAVGLGWVTLPAFNQVTGQHLSFMSPENRTLICWLFAITLLTGTLAGAYPAIYLSAFKPVLVLKGKVSNSAANLNIRKVLVVTQLAVSVCLVFVCIVIYYQLRYVTNARLGFDQDQQLSINLNSSEARTNAPYLMQQLKANPSVLSVTSAGGQLISGDMNLFPSGKTTAAKQSVMLDLVDQNYISSIGLKLLRGSNFSRPVSDTSSNKTDLEVSGMGREIVLNESAVKAYGFGLDNAVGQSLSHYHNGVLYTYRIVGVVRDYHYFSMHSAIGPAGLIVTRPDVMNCIVVKIARGHIPATVDFITKKWAALNPGTPFTYAFFDQIFQWDYQQDLRQQQLTGAFTGIAILVSCIGILGMVAYAVRQKAKEISIRKVLGAGVTDIVRLFLTQYLKMVLIASAIALPLGWYFMQQWLRNFAYRISISWWMFGGSLIVGAVVIVATVGLKTLRAGMSNPVDGLRAE